MIGLLFLYFSGMYNQKMINTSFKKSDAIKSLTKRHYQLNEASQCLSADNVIVEEPLQINIWWFNPEKQQHQESELAIMMRTPGHDEILVLGFLFTEGIIQQYKDVTQITVNSENTNIVDVELGNEISINWEKINRSFTSQSSCGLCGKTSIKALALKTQKTINSDKHWLSSVKIPLLINQLTQRQALFTITGGVHGAAIVSANKWLALYEDVGRHNAVDKVIGDVLVNHHSVENNKTNEQKILLLTGRISFELIQKAVMAAIPVIIAIGAPSSLAISTAKQFDITLIGFTKSDQFSVYSGDWRMQESNHDS